MRRAALVVVLVVAAADAAAQQGTTPTPAPSGDAAAQQGTAPPAAAQQGTSSPGGAGAGGLTEAERRELERALGADAASQQRRAPGGNTPLLPTLMPGVGAGAGAPGGASGFMGGVARAVQSLNPDISVIADITGGWYSDADIVRSGDDPADTGLNLQEVELAFSAAVDPYFRGDVYLTIPNLEGIEVEEAFLTTTSLPGSLQLRAGMMRAALGRQNTQHLHQQLFTRRPHLNALLLGLDGLRAPALELSWLAPLPFYLLVTAEVLSVGGAEEPDQPLATFGGGTRKDLTYVGNVRTFVPFTDTTSLLLGVAVATGKTSQLALPAGGTATDPVPTADADQRSVLYVADAYLRWRPLNVSQSFMSVAWTTEVMLRQLPSVGRLEGALYSQLVWQVARRWFLGVRGEILGLPSGPTLPREYAASTAVTWQLSEFSRVRAHVEGRFPDGADARMVAMLQFEISLGAHGAHPF